LQAGSDQKAILVRVAKDRFVNGVTALSLTVRHLESKGRPRNAIDMSDEVPALIVKEILAVSDQKLQVADLW
jgi:hypothetical protein